MSIVHSLQGSCCPRLRVFGWMLLGLICLGVLTRPFEASAWQALQTRQPAMPPNALRPALGQGLVVAVLGGFRTVIADFVWIRINTIWERRDRVTLDAMLRLVTTLSPQTELFWINSARMLAYDVPHWRIREEGGYDQVPQSRQRAIDREQAEQAFVLLQGAREIHPNSARLYLETGQIYLNRLQDEVNAARWFLLASQQPGAPYYAARIYAELLRRQGKQVEAYNYLRHLYRHLPDSPYAQKPIIFDRIRELEALLNMPIGQRFNPAP